MNRILAMVLLVVVACSEATEPEAPYPATVLVSPKAAMVEMLTETVELTATVKDQNGNTMANVTVAWSSEDTSVATVNSRGVVTPMGDGVVKVVAMADTVSGAADITVQLDVQREALLKFYESLNGDDWHENRNWGTNTPLNRWYGVTAEDGNVSRIEMERNNLVGEIPAEIGLLEHLRGLSLVRGSISGSIPPEIGDLKNLTGLWLWDNELTGPIPPEIENLTELDSLELHFNQLSGPVPTWLGNLANLVTIHIHDNGLTGSLPASLGNLEGLKFLAVNRTELSGRLPRALLGLDLDVFWWHVTDLCAPPDDEFQDWLETIPNHYPNEVCSS